MFVSLLPQFSFLYGIINPDSLVNFFLTAITFILVSLLIEGKMGLGKIFLLVLLTTAGLLTKWIAFVAIIFISFSGSLMAGWSIR